MFRRLTVLVALLVIVAGLAGCSPSTPSMAKVGVSWSLETRQGASAVRAAAVKSATRAAGVNDSSVASGWWVADPAFPYGQIPVFHAWQEVDGVRSPVNASWAVGDPTVGSLTCTSDAADTSLLPTRSGITTVTANVQGTLCAIDVTIYPAFIVESTPGVVASGANAGTGYIFESEVYTGDVNVADIYVQPDGTVQFPGGYVIIAQQSSVLAPQTYLHEVTIPDMTDALATGAAMSMSGTTLVLQTRTGRHVALQVGAAAHRTDATAVGYGLVGGYRLLD